LVKENTLDRVRRACREVSKQAVHVRINHEYIPVYASWLPIEKITKPQLYPNHLYFGQNDLTVAFMLTLDSINFGSGYFPHLRKRPGMSGYYTVASCLHDIFKIQGPISPNRLTQITVEECTQIFDQDSGNKPIQELMQHFAKAFNDLGKFLLDHFGGSFINLLESAESSAERLARLLTTMPYFNDVGIYKGFDVPFLKRAQITAYDLSLAFNGQGCGHFHDLDQLTIFADNLVPHVLRIDEILIYEESLISRINAGKLIPPGSTEEVEIRACAIHAVELIKKQIVKSGQGITSPALDNFLWNRGQQPRYKAIPRHRTRCVFY
jgi:hypothetical protein